MSELSAIELGAVDRPNRFQVNPVNHKNDNNKDKKADRNSQEIYRRLPNTDGEVLEDDTFNEDHPQIVNKRQSR